MAAEAVPRASRSGHLCTVAAAVALLAWPITDALALSLGRVQVQSTLGQPLRAEIDIPAISPDEASSLTAVVAPLTAFKSAGMEYNAALSTVRIKVLPRGDGRAVLELTSDRVINDPFVDLIIEANWASGRIVRDYTLLFDPPEMGRNAPQVISSPRLPDLAPASPPVTVSPSAPVAPVFYPPPPSAYRPLPAGNSRLPPARLEEARRATAELAANIQSQAGPLPPGRGPLPSTRAAVNETPNSRFSPAQVAAARAAVAGQPAARPVLADKSPATDASGKQVQVQRGDSAARIAAANKPAAVSLDQMLLALLRQNPDAFVGNNVNRLRSGAVLTLPTAAQAEAVPAQEASRTIVAQSRDFNTFRRRLAGGVPAARVDTASREARGTLQAQVTEPKAPSATPDKLTLSKSSGSAEEKLASNRQAQDASTRVAELSKNLDELNKLKSGSSALAGGAAPASAAGGGLPAVALASPSLAASAPPPASSAPAASAPAPVASTSAVVAPVAVPMDAASSAASAPASAPAKPKPAPAPILSKAEPGFIDDLLENPLLLPLGGGLLLALLVFGIFRMRQNRQAAQSSLAYPDSRLTADSLTGNGKMRDGASSMGYSPSQLDAAGDVDPVEEADVYLAYGRDQQAEEILKEAVQRMPPRLAVHAKLLEIYAKRGDVRAFDHQAAEAFQVSKGQGSEWARIRALGQDLSPANPLYRSPGAPPVAAAAPAVAAAPTRVEPVPHTVPGPGAAAAMSPAAAGSLDFDLDFSADEPGGAAAGKTTSPPVAETDRREPTLFGETMPAAPVQAPPASTKAEPLDLPDLVFDEPPAPPPARRAAPPPPADSPADMITFDLDSLSLEPISDIPATTPSTAQPATPSNPLEVKLELAVEFLAIGDTEGARALIEEVMPQATGTIKARAQQMLADLRR